MEPPGEEREKAHGNGESLQVGDGPGDRNWSSLKHFSGVLVNFSPASNISFNPLLFSVQTPIFAQVWAQLASFWVFLK